MVGKTLNLGGVSAVLASIIITSCGGAPPSLTREVSVSDMAPLLSRGDKATFEPVMMQTSLTAGDVLLYRHSVQTQAGGLPEDQEFIRRLIGFPGDEVQIDRVGGVVVNGDVLERDEDRECVSDETCYEVVFRPTTTTADAVSISLSDQQYLVMNDNRAGESEDGKIYDLIQKKSIIGRYVGEAG